MSEVIGSEPFLYRKINRSVLSNALSTMTVISGRAFYRMKNSSSQCLSTEHFLFQVRELGLTETNICRCVYVHVDG